MGLRDFRRQLIERFAQSFDIKAWDALKNCLAKNVFTDYSALRGTPPETMTGERFVELRRQALQHLQTEHAPQKREFTIQGDNATAKVEMLITRRNNQGEVFNTHCEYTFGLSRIDGSWLIRSIVQKVIANEGNSKIHQGMVK